MKLQRQFNLVIIPLVIVPLLILGGTAYSYLLKSEQQKLLSSMTINLANLRQQINIKLFQMNANLELLASDKVVSHYALIEDEYTRYKLYQRGVYERFKSYQNVFQFYQEIRYILPDGYEDTHWVMPGYKNVTEEEANSFWFPLLNTNNDATFQIIGHNPDTGEPSLYLFKALILRDLSIEDDHTPAHLRGFIGTTISLNWLQTELQKLGFEKQSNISFSLLNGEAIFSFGEPLLGQGDINGEAFHDAYYQVQENTLFGYKLTYSVDKKQASIQAQELALTIFLITLTSIIITLIILLGLLRRSVVNPIQTLVLASHKIAEGDFETSVKLGESSEINELALGFNEMAKSLVENNEKIRFIAYHDSLTRLPNRRMFHYLLNNALVSADRCQDKVALFFLDIDNFKIINDSLGHDVGDLLLQEFSSRVKSCLRADDAILPMKEEDSVEPIDDDNYDILARLGGDEFTIVLPRLQEVLDASVIAQRIIKSMQVPFFINEHQLQITTSIGITIYPDNGYNIEDLIKHADIAMYHAKAQGKNNFQFYADDLNKAIANRIERENALRKAIKQGELAVYFQPQVSLVTKCLYGLEALVRWHHPSKGIISPLEFIPLAEETGMIVDLGTWVMAKSCQVAEEWRQLGILNCRVSVNVSSFQFKRQDVFDLVQTSLISSGLPAHFLTIELTESALMTNQVDNANVLRRIKALGVSISLDDFGTGYSSLSYLRRFPVDILKIDKEFIFEAKHQTSVRSIVSAIILMAHALGLKVIAEGVEEEDELNYLIDLDCDVIQGFYYSKALPEGLAKNYLENANVSDLHEISPANEMSEED